MGDPQGKIVVTVQVVRDPWQAETIAESFLDAVGGYYQTQKHPLNVLHQE